MMTEKVLFKCCFVTDLVQKSAKKCDILIENGRFSAIEPEIIDDSAKIINAEGLFAAPGLVDMHVHLRDPGQTHKEDILSGCEAAKAGGITSLLAMPNTKPVCDSKEIISYIKEKAAKSDIHIYPAAAVTKGQLGLELCGFKSLKDAGAAAFSDDGRPVESAEMMLSAMKAAKECGAPVISHCEDMSLAAGGIVNEKIAAELGVKGIPTAAEETQVAREIVLSACSGLPIHIAHVSTKGSVALIRAAKEHGIAVTCETCPHYFSLDETALRSRDADYRMNPPLRSRDDVDAIIEGLRDGTIDAIVTDHAPHAAEEKADFLKAPNGVVGLETSFAAGITYLVKPGYLTLSQLINKMSLSPAIILGLDAGSLTAGKPADMILFDPDEKWVVDPQKLRSKSKNTPYKGMTLVGKVKVTVCGGKIVFQDK